MTNNRTCPNCQEYSFPLWTKVFATWPFVIRCRNCRARVHLSIPFWLNFLVQILAQSALWGILIWGLVAGGQNIFTAAISGAVAAILIAIAPGFFVGLRVKE